MSPKKTPPPVSRETAFERLQHAWIELDKACAHVFDERLVPGLALAWVATDPGGGLLEATRAYGKKRLGASGEAAKDNAVTTSTVFALASLSKPLTSTFLAALMTAAPDRISWDDLVTIIGDDGVASPLRLSDGDGVRSARQMLSHTSGLRDHDGDLLEDIGHSEQYILKRLQTIRNLKAPGTMQYTNMGYTAGARSLVRGWARNDDNATFEGYAKAHFFDRLDMKRTAFQSSPPDAGDFAWPHVRRGPGPDGEHAAAGEWVAASPEARRAPGAQVPAGGACSTAEDMLRFLALHLRRGRSERMERIVAEDYLDGDPQKGIYHSPAGRPASFYALGWNVTDYGFPGGAANRRSYSHSGAFLKGAATCLRIDPDAGVGLCVLTNGEPTGVPEAVVACYFNALYGYDPSNYDKAKASIPETFAAVRDFMREQLHVEDRQRERYRTPPASPTPHRPLRSHAGRYANAFYENVVVAVEGDALRYTFEDSRGADGERWDFTLRHWDGDTFLYETKGENYIGPASVQFRFEGDRVVSLLDESLNRSDYTDDGQPLPGGLGELRRLQ